MCQLQSCQPLSLKSHYIMITHQARHRGSQMLVSENLQRPVGEHGFNKPPERWR